jgi:hypothetical protein
MEMDNSNRDFEERIWREAEQTRQNDEERHRRESDERERARREALLRQIQAEARLEHQAERAARPVATLVALAVSALLALFGFGSWLMHAEDAELAQRRAAVAGAVEQERAVTLAQHQAARTRFEGDLAHLRGRIAAVHANRP